MSPRADTVAEGDEVPPFEVHPKIDLVVRYCALSWTFVPFFYDAEAARAQGLPGTLVPGPLKLALLYRAVEEWLGDGGFVRQVRAAHRRPDITGRPLRIAGQVSRVYEENGERLADLELAVVQEDGTRSVQGFATVVLQ